MADKQTMEGNKENLMWKAALSFLIFFIGSVLAWMSVQHKDIRMQKDFLQEARLIAEAIEPQCIRNLTGTSADLKNPDYLRLKEALACVRQFKNTYRFLYLMGRKPGGEVFFYVDNEPVGSEDESPAGQIYAEVPDEYLGAFNRRQARVAGPVTDRWGTWLTALVPIVLSPDVPGNIAVLGVDMDAGKRLGILIRSTIPSIVFTLLLLITQYGSLYLLKKRKTAGAVGVRMNYLDGGIVAAVGIFITLFLAWHGNDLEKNAIRDSFQAIAKSKTALLSEAFHTLQDTEIEGLANFFEGSDTVSQDEFNRYTHHLQKNDAVQGWEWVPAVKASEKQSHQRLMQRMGFPGYRIWEKDVSGRAIEASDRDDYYPVQYVVPLEKNHKALGYDLGSETVRKKGLLEARETGRVSATDPVVLVQEGESRKSILIYRPVFSSGNALKGFVLAVLRFETLLSKAPPDRNAAVQLLQLNSEKAPEWLSNTSNEYSIMNFSDSGALVWRPVFVFGKAFCLLSVPGIDFHQTYPARAWWIILVVGMTVSIAFAWFVGGVLHQRNRLNYFVAERTKELTESESLQRNLLENIDAGVVIIDRDTHVIERVNQKGVALFGGTEAQIVGKVCHCFLCSEGKGSCPVTDRGQAVDNSDCILLKADGSQLSILKSVRHIQINGRDKLLETFIDISVRKKMENSLQENQSRLDLALQSALMGAWEWDIIEDKRHFDAKVCQLLGITPATFKGTAEEFFDAVHPDDREMLKEALTRTIDQDMPYEPEYRTMWPDGSVHYIGAHGRLVRDDSGRPAKIIGLIGDITEKKIAQLESDKKYSIYNNVPVGLYRSRLNDGKIVMANKRMAEIFGYRNVEECIKNYVAVERYVYPEMRNKVVESINEHGRLDNFETQIRKNDDSIVWIQFSGIVSPEKGYFEGMCIDVTDRKQAEKELFETNLKLEAAIEKANIMAVEGMMASSAKSEFLANMSHEIRTPMNGVIGMTGLLLDTELTEEQRRYAETVQTSGESLLALINDILDFSKIEAGKMDMEIMSFDLQDMLDDFAVTLALKAQEKGLEFVCAADPQVPSLLRGDPGRLRQILTNLAGNAVKFTHKGEVAVRVMTESETDQTVLLRFSVTDTGIGIPKDKLGLLFDKFTQADASTTRQYGGTGLGLAISMQLAELMGGHAGVESIENEGSEFWFTACLEKQAGGMKTDMQIPADLLNTRVLIVDDNATNREILIIRLTAWGTRPAEVQDGPGALSALLVAAEEKDPFRLAIIDMLMPGMDGEALGRAIKSDKRLSDTRMVMLTSMGARGDARRFADIGFNAYLTKPVRHLDLHRALCLALGENHGPDQMMHPIVTRHTDRTILNRFKDRKARILLAEDNITNQQVALGILKKLGLRADAVANGEEALKALENLPYDLVLMDVQMPVMNGLDATRKIRDPEAFIFNHSIPVIAMTANAMQGDREKCLEAGMNDYVSKPVSPQTLAAVLDQWLMGPQEEQEEVKADEIKTPVKTDEKIQEQGDSPLAVFDRDDLLDRLMGDEELLQTVITIFLDDIPIQMADIKESVIRGNADRVGSLAHKIKGAAANIGGDDFSRAAHEMEIAGKAGNATRIKKLLSRLEKAYVRLADAMMAKEG